MNALDAVAFLVGAGTKLYDDVKDRGIVTDAQEPRLWWMWVLKAALFAGFAFASCQSSFVALLLSVIFVGCFAVGQLDHSFWKVLAVVPPLALVACHGSRAVSGGMLTPNVLLTALVAIAVIRYEAVSFPEEQSERKTAFRLRSALLLAILVPVLRQSSLAFVLPFVYAGLGYLIASFFSPTPFQSGPK